MTKKFDSILAKAQSIAEDYLTRNLDEPQKSVSLSKLRLLQEERLGPAIFYYPTWHPIVRSEFNGRGDNIFPGFKCGYEGLGYTEGFLNGFITCPYNDGKKVFESVDKINREGWKGFFNERGLPLVRLVAEKIDFPLYHLNTTPVMVLCDWDESQLMDDGTIAAHEALSLFVDRESKDWKESHQFCESWKTLEPYLVGQPHHGVKSPFVSQAVGKAMKAIYSTLVSSGALGTPKG